MLLAIPLVAWIATRALVPATSECVLPPMSRRPLDLGSRADRRRLAAELARVDAIAARYREVIRTVPRASDSIDAVRTLAARPDRAYRYCRAVLRDELAARYEVDLAQFEAIAADD